MSKERLYGMNGWESLDSDLGSAVESYIDDRFEPVVDEVVEFEEFSVVPVRRDFPDAERILERIHDDICDDGMGDEGFHDDVERAMTAPDVVTAMEAVLDLIGSKISYRMADELLRTIKVHIWPLPPDGWGWTEQA